MRHLLALALLLAMPAFAQVPLKDQPIPEAQKKALADHAARGAKAKADQAACREEQKKPVKSPAQVPSMTECMRAKGYK